MSMLDALRYRLYLLTNREANDREAAEEIAFHLDLESRQQAAESNELHPTIDDKDAARRRFGNVTYYREELWRMAGFWLFDELVQDARFALRSFLRTPGFTAVAVLTLAVGIGANTAIFSAVDALLLRPLPYRDPSRLMNISITGPAVGKNPARTDLNWSYLKFQVFRDGQTAFEDVTLWSSIQFTLRVGDESFREVGEFTDSHYFPVLGIKPSLGRALQADEDRLNGAHVVVISTALWNQLFNADPQVRGKSLEVDGTPFEIIGVAPPNFTGLSGGAKFWIPYASPPAVWATSGLTRDPYSGFHLAVGRLKSGVSPVQALAAVRQLGSSVDAAYPIRGLQGVHLGATATELNELRVDDRVRRTLLILFGAVGLLLLIACANVANLFLVRASARRREIATRLALGASRARIIRQLLVESVMLSIMGGVASVVFAFGGVKLLSTLQLASVLRFENLGGLGAVDTSTIHLDATALLFTGIVAIGTGIVFGLVPAMQSTKQSLAGSIKEDSAARGRGRGLSSRSVLVTMEIALAVVLLSASGLMIRSLSHLIAIRPGFDAERVLTMRVNRSAAWSRDSISTFYDVALQKLATLPGVTDVAMIDCPPLAGCTGTGVRFPDRPPVGPGMEPVAGTHWVTPTIFSVLHIPILRGRTFNSGDRPDTRKVVIISQSAAKQFWPNEDPIGRPLNFNGPDTAYVIGVVGDVHFGTIDSIARPDVYVSYYQVPLSFRMMLFLRTTGEPTASTNAVHNALREVAPGFPMYDVQTMEQRLGGALAYARFSALLLTFFAGLALILAAIGTYGVMSFAVSQRTREIGVRSALGATGSSIVRLVIGEGMTLAGIGIAVGLVVAIVVTRLLTSLLYDVQTTDPLTLVGIVVVLVVAMLGANWIPARRALGISVVEALKAD